MSDTDNLWTALLKAQKQAKSVVKEATNAHLKNRYASSEALVEAAKTALNDNGLVPVPLARKVQASASGATELAVTFRLVHAASKEHQDFETTIAVVPKAGMPADKAEMASDTYNLGYFMKNLVMLIRDDPDTAVDARDDRDPKVTELVAKIRAAGVAKDMAALQAHGKQAKDDGLNTNDEVRAAYTESLKQIKAVEAA